MIHALLASMVQTGQASTSERIVGFILFLAIGQCAILLGMYLCYLPYW